MQLSVELERMRMKRSNWIESQWHHREAGCGVETVETVGKNKGKWLSRKHQVFKNETALPTKSGFMPRNFHSNRQTTSWQNANGGLTTYEKTSGTWKPSL